MKEDDAGKIRRGLALKRIEMMMRKMLTKRRKWLICRKTRTRERRGCVGGGVGKGCGYRFEFGHT